MPELKTYQKKLKKLLDDNVVDILIFGSLVKGGRPKDIDVALLVKEKAKVDTLKMKKILQGIISKEIDVQILDINSIYSSLWLTLIKEGFSVGKNNFLSSIV